LLAILVIFAFAMACGRTAKVAGNATSFFPSPSSSESATLSASPKRSVAPVASHQPRIISSAATQTGIAGRVVDHGGNPVEGVCVSPESHSAPFSEDSSRGDGIKTGADGRYVVDINYSGYMPPTGSPWTVEFWDCRSSPVFGPKDVNFGQPKKGEVVNIDATLSPGGVIQGTVTNEIGVPAAGACVEDFSGGFFMGMSERMVPDYVVHADDQGRFRVSGLNLSNQRLLFGLCEGSPYRPTWFNNRVVHCYFSDCRDAEQRSNYEAADPIVVTAGKTSDVGQVVLTRSSPVSSPSAT